MCQIWGMLQQFFVRLIFLLVGIMITEIENERIILSLHGTASSWLDLHNLIIVAFMFESVVFATIFLCLLYSSTLGDW